jgi:hypothetical protein
MTRIDPTPGSIRFQAFAGIADAVGAAFDAGGALWHPSAKRPVRSRVGKRVETRVMAAACRTLPGGRRAGAVD